MTNEQKIVVQKLAIRELNDILGKDNFHVNDSTIENIKVLDLHKVKTNMDLASWHAELQLNMEEVETKSLLFAVYVMLMDQYVVLELKYTMWEIKKEIIKNCNIMEKKAVFDAIEMIDRLIYRSDSHEALTIEKQAFKEFELIDPRTRFKMNELFNEAFRLAGKLMEIKIEREQRRAEKNEQRTKDKQ